MNEQITSAAELDALPVGSVVLDAYAAACTRVRQQDMYDWVRASSAAPNGGKHFHPPYFPATVLYRPDRPQRVQPSREDVARLLAHQNTDWIHGYLGADPATGETHDHGPRCSNWEPYAEDADDVLALFAQQPTVAEVKAEALPVVDTRVLDGLRAAEARLRFIQHHWPADTCAEVLVMLERLNADRLEAEALSDADRIEREARS